MHHDLADLPELLDPDDDDVDAPVATILQMTIDAEPARLEIVIRLNWPDHEPEHRTLECINVVRWVLIDGSVSEANVFDEHPGLLDYTDERGELFFTGAPSDPSRTAAALRDAHISLVGRYLDFDEVVNIDEFGRRPLSNLLSLGYGKLAEGSLTLMREFQALLEQGGSRTSLLRLGNRKLWANDERRWVDAPNPLSLLDLGESWIVAQRFVVNEPADPPRGG
jgi:hypothetical protein